VAEEVADKVEIEGRIRKDIPQGLKPAIIDPALKDKTALPHPCRKNKGAARLHPTDEDLSVGTPRAGHPKFVSSFRAGSIMVDSDVRA
jgi:hypothetical protein